MNSYASIHRRNLRSPFTSASASSRLPKKLAPLGVAAARRLREEMARIASSIMMPPPSMA